MKSKYSIVPDEDWAMPSARSGVLRTEPVPVSALRAPAAIAGPTESFIRLTRNPKEVASWPFEPTVKGEGDVVL